MRIFFSPSILLPALSSYGRTDMCCITVIFKEFLLLIRERRHPHMSFTQDAEHSSTPGSLPSSIFTSSFYASSEIPSASYDGSEELNLYPFREAHLPSLCSNSAEVRHMSAGLTNGGQSGSRYGSARSGIIQRQPSRELSEAASAAYTGSVRSSQLDWLDPDPLVRYDLDTWAGVPWYNLELVSQKIRNVTRN